MNECYQQRLSGLIAEAKSRVWTGKSICGIENGIHCRHLGFTTQYTLCHQVSESVTEEPCAGKPLARFCEGSHGKEKINMSSTRQSKLLYLGTSLCTFLLSAVLLYMLAAGPLYNFATYTTAGLVIVIVTFLIAAVTFCTTIQAIIRLFQKQAKVQESGIEGEKRAAADMALRLIRLRLFSFSFVFHLAAGCIAKMWSVKGAVEAWTLIYVAFLVLADVGVLIRQANEWKKHKKGIGIAFFHMVVIVVGFCFGIMIFSVK